MRRLLIGLGITWREFGAALHKLDPQKSARRGGHV
jgi:hypothetical protein